MTTVRTARHLCARCGRPQPRDKLLYSTATGSYYCLAFKACDRRMMRQLKQAMTEVAT